MKAKFYKCSSLAMKRISLVNAQVKTTRSYMLYDPKLKLAGKEMPFIHQAPMRFLGGWRSIQRPQCGEAIYKDLSDSEVRTTTKIVTEYEVRVKLGIHENQVVSRISWEFIIYCFPIMRYYNSSCLISGRQQQTTTLKMGRTGKMCKPFHHVHLVWK